MTKTLFFGCWILLAEQDDDANEPLARLWKLRMADRNTTRVSAVCVR